MGSRLRIHHVAALGLPVAGLCLLVLLLPESPSRQGSATDSATGCRGSPTPIHSGWCSRRAVATSLAGSALAWRAAPRLRGAVLLLDAVALRHRVAR